MELSTTFKAPKRSTTVTRGIELNTCSDARFRDEIFRAYVPDHPPATLCGMSISQLLRLDSEHFRQHQKRNRPDAWESSGDDQFGRVYDVFIFLALAFSVLEMLMFHLGRRRLVETSFYERGLRGAAVAGGGNLRAGPLRSLLDEEDLREAAWESRGMQNETVQQVCR